MKKALVKAYYSLLVIAHTASTLDQATILRLIKKYPLYAAGILFLMVGTLGKSDFWMGYAFGFFFALYCKALEGMAKRNRQRHNNPNQPPSGSS